MRPQPAWSSRSQGRDFPAAPYVAWMSGHLHSACVKFAFAPAVQETGAGRGLDFHDLSEAGLPSAPVQSQVRVCRFKSQEQQQVENHPCEAAPGRGAGLVCRHRNGAALAEQGPVPFKGRRWPTLH